MCLSEALQCVQGPLVDQSLETWADLAYYQCAYMAMDGSYENIAHTRDHESRRVAQTMVSNRSARAIVEPSEKIARYSGKYRRRVPW